jgi:hypothetical protein
MNLLAAISIAAGRPAGTDASVRLTQPGQKRKLAGGFHCGGGDGIRVQVTAPRIGDRHIIRQRLLRTPS